MNKIKNRRLRHWWRRGKKLNNFAVLAIQQWKAGKNEEEKIWQYHWKPLNRWPIHEMRIHRSKYTRKREFVCTLLFFLYFSLIFLKRNKSHRQFSFIYFFCWKNFSALVHIQIHKYIHATTFRIQQGQRKKNMWQLWHSSGWKKSKFCCSQQKTYAKIKQRMGKNRTNTNDKIKCVK